MNDLTIPAGFETLVAKAADWGIRVVGVLVALFAAWVFAGWLRRAISSGCARRGLDITLSRFAANLARYALLTAAVLGCLGVFGIETSSFAALIGALGLAVGLAFQGTLGNFAAGAMLLIFRPFKVGDVIRAGGEIGKVTEIELFTTELTTADNRRIIVPNGKIFGDTIENISHHETRRIEVSVGTDYAADTRRTRDILLEATGKVTTLLSDPAPVAVLAELGDSAVSWKVRAWCKSDDYWGALEALTEEVKLSLDAAKIGIPYPQLDVHLDK